MWFVLLVVIAVLAGWAILAATTGASGDTPRKTDPRADDSVPANAYDNPYDTNENNDRPFEPDASDASDGSAGDSDSCSDGDSGSSSD